MFRHQGFNKFPSTPLTPPQISNPAAKNRRSPTNRGFEDTYSDSMITAPPTRQSRAGDVESLQPPKISVVETAQSTAEPAPEETNVSPVIGNVFPPDPRVIG